MAARLRGALVITAALTSASAFAPTRANVRGPSAVALAPATSARCSVSSARVAMSSSTSELELSKVDMKKLPTSVQRAITKKVYDPNSDRFVKVVGDELVWGEDRWDREAITKYWREQTGMGSTDPRWDSLLSSKANRKDRILMSPGASESAVIEPEGWCKARHQFKINNTFDEKKGRYYNEVAKERSQAAQKINAQMKKFSTDSSTESSTESSPRKKKKKNGWTQFNEKRMAKAKAAKATSVNGTSANSPKPNAKAKVSKVSVDASVGKSVVDEAEMQRIASTYWPVWSPHVPSASDADVAAFDAANAAANAAAKAAAKAAANAKANAAAALLPASQRHWLKEKGGPVVSKEPKAKAKATVKKSGAPKKVSKPKTSTTVLGSLKDEDICLISGDYENCMMAGGGERKLQQLAKSGLKTGTVKFWNKEAQYGFITPNDKRNGGTGDVFVHLSALLKQSVALGEGAPVEYDVQKGPSDRMNGQPRASLVIVSDPCWIEPKKDYRNGRDPLTQPKGDYRKGRDPSKGTKQPKGDFRKKPAAAKKKGGAQKGGAKKGGEAGKVSAKASKATKSAKAANTGGAKKQGEKKGEKKAAVGAASGAASSAAAKPQPTGEQKTNLLQVLMNIPTRTGLAP